MKRTAIVVGAAVVVSAFGVASERSARACGGCFHPPTQTVTDITDERMLLSVSTTQSTLYDQIQYSGSPTSFAWVLPIHGPVTVGLSADVLFDSVDVLTETQITPPPSSCAPCFARGVPGLAPMGGGAASDASDAGASFVTVTHVQNVGPYATVQLHSTDASALDTWLAQNGYVIPADVTPVIDEYVTEGFDFLAMKLLPNMGVQAMRPVRVTSAGASLSLPLRMAAVGTGAIVGITIWVVSDGRYQPQNYPFFHIDDKDLVWDYSSSLSNYTTLRVENEATLHNGGWEIESSLTLNQQIVTSVVLSGGQYYPGGGFGGAPTDPGLDYLPVPATGGDAGGEAGAGQTAEEVRTEDLATLFAGITAPNVRITRIRGDIAHAAMTTDLVLQASADQSELSNIRSLTRGVNEVCACGFLDSGVSSSGSPASSSGQGASAAGSSGTSSGQAGAGSTGTSLGQGTAGGVSNSTSSGGVGGGNQGGSSSGPEPANGSNASGSPSAESGRGCAAAPSSNAGAVSAFAIFFGFAVTRMLRSRRRS
ncbi:MAG: DUF2330 domain-containing protein [Polyangiaceae bacterium]